MKIKKLIEILEQLDPEMEAGNTGHFGEFYPFEKPSVRKDFGESARLVFSIPDIGEEPE